MKKKIKKPLFACILITSFLALLWLAYIIYKLLRPTFMIHFTGTIIVIGTSTAISFLWYLFFSKQSEQKKRNLQTICLTYIFLIYVVILLNLLFWGFMNSMNRKTYIGLDFKTWFELGNFIPLQTVQLWLGARRLDLIAGNLILFLPLGMWESMVVGNFVTKKYHPVIIPVIVLSIWLARFISYINVIDIDQLLLWLIGASIGYISGQKIQRKIYSIPNKELET